jgi:hypothetical protein
MNIIKLLFCRIYGISPDDLDKLAAARPRHESFSDMAKRLSGR